MRHYFRAPCTRRYNFRFVEKGRAAKIGRGVSTVAKACMCSRWKGLVVVVRLPASPVPLGR